MKNRPSSAVAQGNEARHCQWKRCIRADWAASTPAWALIDWNSWGVNSLVWKGVLLVCLAERVSSSLAGEILGVINYGMMCLIVPGRKALQELDERCSSDPDVECRGPIDTRTALSKDSSCGCFGVDARAEAFEPGVLCQDVLSRSPKFDLSRVTGQGC